MASRRRSGRACGAGRAAGLLCALLATPVHAGTALITGLQDVGFSQLNAMASQSATTRQCVNSNTGKYSVTATGSGSGGGFQLSAGAGLTLPYALEWSDSSTASTGQSLTSGVALTGQLTRITSCVLGSINSTLIVRLASNDLQAAVAGVTYSGVVTLLIAPQ